MAKKKKSAKPMDAHSRECDPFARELRVMPTLVPADGGKAIVVLIGWAPGLNGILGEVSGCFERMRRSYNARSVTQQIATGATG
jgi:hypothetical protein